MKFETVKDFITFCDNARQDINGDKINVENLDRFYAVADVVKELFGDAKIEVERPKQTAKATNIIIKNTYNDFEGERKDRLLKVLANVDGVSFSGCSKHDEQDGKFVMILTVEDIWVEE